MNLAESTPLVTGGPLWATRIEANLLLIDQHDHSTGKGVPITPAGLNINANLVMSNFAITSLLSTDYTAQLSALSGANRVYVVNGDLYYNNGAGAAVQVTSGTAVNVAGVGGITGLGGTTGAVTYSNITKTFSFTQDANNAASLIAGSVSIGEPGVVSPSFITLKSPTALAGSYDITLPAALPASTKYVQIDGAGVLTATDALDAVTLESLAGVMQIKDAGVTNAKLANMAALTVKANATNASAAPQDIAAASDGLVLRRSGTALAFGQVVAAGIASNAVETAKINDAAVTQPKLASQISVKSSNSTASSTSSYGGVPDKVTAAMTVGNGGRYIRVFLLAGNNNGTVAFDPTAGAGGWGQVTFLVRINGGSWLQATFHQRFGNDNGGGIPVLLPPSAFIAELEGGSYPTGASVEFGVEFSVGGVGGTIEWTDVVLQAVQL
jgi:hypothetical protein